MPLMIRVVLAVLLLGVVGFCSFGFLATFEPTNDSMVGWRIGYGAVGVASLVGAVWIVRAARSSRDKPRES